MKILITGANGFIGKNLISNLSLNKNVEIFKYDIDSTEDELDNYTKECDFVYHLAGVNRPIELEEYMNGNYGFTSVLIDKLKKHKNRCPIMISSSIQAELDNEYGKSKKASEDLLFSYAKENDIKVYVFRFPNLFGKWCRPNYNSVIATWCYNISHNIDIQVNDESKKITLCYIDDVCSELIKCLNNEAHKEGKFYYIPTIYEKTLGEIAYIIKEFKFNDRTIMVPSTGDDFIKKLYATYMSYVPLDELVVDLNEHRDERGIFCELVRTKETGQVSVSTTNPKVIRGGHYHNTKMERFIVIKGKAKIEFEHIITHEKIEFLVSSDKLQYVTIPVGYQHSINNIDDDELVLILWANELFDPNVPDTYVMEESK